MAWVANRSTTVRKAVNPITTVRNRTLEAWACISGGDESKVEAACVMIDPRVSWKGEVTLRSGPRFLGVTSNAVGASSHVVVVLVVEDIADEQNDGLVSQV